MAPRLLDLFCCEGGAGSGYAAAGFDVTGVDLLPQARNPHPVIVGDAIEYLRRHYHEFDAIHASPPCQSYSAALKHLAKPQPMLIEALLYLLPLSGKPWVIENVMGAPLAEATGYGRNGAILCGSMFGLKVRRHRIFECSFPIFAPGACDHSRPAMNPHNSAARARLGRGPEKIWANEMGVPWMSKHGAREAVPPAYTEYVGTCLRAHYGI